MAKMTQAQFARHRGCSRQYVGKLVRQGAIPVGDDGRIDPLAADLALDGGAVAAGQNGEHEPSMTDQLTRARAASEYWRGKIMDLNYRQQTGDLLLREEVTARVEDAAAKLVCSIEALPSLCDELVAAHEEGGIEAVRAVLREQVGEITQTLWADLQRIVAGEAPAETGETDG